ncbi:hypothetical protein IQ255_21655 [Pleurocapsales cyanobacterium LEGE 10410]|nr:hypothetical protein [Pleurocapsales cyanobacterium LEGE 10410]
MFNQTKIYAVLVGLGFLLALTPNLVLAQEVGGEMPASAGETSKFHKIEQPIGLKLVVTVGGLGLIGAELWWFVFSKN